MGELGRNNIENMGDNPGEMEQLTAIDLGEGEYNASFVAVGNHVSCAIRGVNSSVVCWGWNNYGQLGRDDVWPVGDGIKLMKDLYPLAPDFKDLVYYRYTPASTPSPTQTPTPSQSDLSVSAIAGIVGGVVLILALVTTAVWFTVRSPRKLNSQFVPTAIAFFHPRDAKLRGVPL